MSVIVRRHLVWTIDAFEGPHRALAGSRRALVRLRGAAGASRGFLVSLRSGVSRGVLGSLGQAPKRVHFLFFVRGEFRDCLARSGHFQNVLFCEDCRRTRRCTFWGILRDIHFANQYSECNTKTNDFTNFLKLASSKCSENTVLESRYQEVKFEAWIDKC